jgi:UDP-N-acetylmuramoylalanine--D-glutamate ligase
MKDWTSEFKDKKITVMGLGLLGRGVGDIAFLATYAADVVVTDLKSEKDLATSVEELKNFKNITFVLGEHRLEDFNDRDFILKAAGVPLDSPYIAEAKKNNIPVEMSAALFARLSGATIIGVTGTRGKSTVTHLLFNVIQNWLAEKGETKKVFLGGNVKGVSTLAFLEEAQQGDMAVLELDSWQLQGFGESKISPHISIFTTFLPDHLNYYKNSLHDYFSDKANIFKYQTTNDALILSKNVQDVIVEHALEKEIKSQIKIVDPQHIPSSWKPKIPGEHNALNIALVLEAAMVLGITEEIVKKSVEAFSGVPGRLELIQEYKGIKIYNDTTATTPDATIAGLKALGSSHSESKNIILIMGGADKNLNMTQLTEILPNFCKSVILLSGTGTDRIQPSLGSSTYGLEAASTLQDAIQKALAVAQSGDIILLSPAFASFGMFKNEFDRGEQFNNIVRNLH